MPATQTIDDLKKRLSAAAEKGYHQVYVSQDIYNMVLSHLFEFYGTRSFFTHKGDLYLQGLKIVLLQVKQ